MLKLNTEIIRRLDNIKFRSSSQATTSSQWGACSCEQRCEQAKEETKSQYTCHTIWCE